MRVEFGGRVIADTGRAIRVCETASPPAYYIPPGDVDLALLEPADGVSQCEWKGRARYWSVRVGDALAPNAAWSYPDPAPAFAAITGHLAFYAQRVDACWVGEDRVTPQSGRFYGGWITPDVVGPFKGDPGTEGW